MNHTPDSAAAAGNGGKFDPRQAAALLDQATQQTRRKLAPAQPWLLTIRAVMVLAVLGACWLNVRGQHPYRGPTSAVLPFVVVFVIANFVATVTVRKRATAGVSGKSRLRPWEIIVLTLAWIAVFAVIGALAGTGVSPAIVYSLIPLTVPLILAGLAWAGINAARADWRPCGVGVGVAVVGAVGLFAGRAGAWAVVGVGLFIVLLGSAVAIVWQQRRSVVWP
ncbi:MAG: hypothetical protein ABR922_22525 [Streptosporangiaceae bacterium]|jgi:uncharacterized protein YybS (DUF2232 family)